MYRKGFLKSKYLHENIVFSEGLHRSSDSGRGVDVEPRDFIPGKHLKTESSLEISG